MYGPDALDNYTLAQTGHTPASGTYTQDLTNSSALSGATFGLPWLSFWQYADEDQLAVLTSIMSLLESVDATITNNTDIINYETIVSPNGWDWDYGNARGVPDESKFTTVKVGFYNNIATFLSQVSNTDVRTLQDIADSNYANDAFEGGKTFAIADDNGTTTYTGGGIQTFWSGQDSFLASLATNGVRDEIYYQARKCRQSRGSTSRSRITARAHNCLRFSSRRTLIRLTRSRRRRNILCSHYRPGIMLMECRMGWHLCRQYGVRLNLYAGGMQLRMQGRVLLVWPWELGGRGPSGGTTFPRISSYSPPDEQFASCGWRATSFVDGLGLDCV